MKVTRTLGLAVAALSIGWGPCVLAQVPEPAPATAPATAPAQQQQQPEPQIQTVPPPGLRIPQQKTLTNGALQGILLDDMERPIPGAQVRLVGPSAVMIIQTNSEGDGIFRLLRVPAGTYDLVITPGLGGQAYRKSAITINGGEVVSIKIDDLKGFGVAPQAMPVPQTMIEITDGQYTLLNRRPDANGVVVPPRELKLPAEDIVFQERPDRWNAEMPTYRRYPNMETPYVLGHWYDPFNRNVFKADKPIFGQKTFIQLTADSITAGDGRRLPLTSGQSAANADSSGFFGKGGQVFLAQTLRTTFDMFHGDTAAFRPVDWRIRVTSAANLNYIDTQENQVVSPNVQFGTTRFDTHVGLQEAFGEVKLADVGSDYDFINVRVGIQQFVSDFRGFIFADEQPGVRFFGNLRSNRFQWNLAGFDLLEKNTNSGLNSFARRGREVAIGNIYMQDSLFKGYTSQLNYVFVRDDGRAHYDDNGFLVRPAPILNIYYPNGSVHEPRLDVNYAGYTGDGHIGSINITDAIYQAWGHTNFNQFTGKRAYIDAQLGAVELSKDYSYMRYRASFLYASGSDNPLSGRARGFSSIVDAEAFAGGEFSFFNREGIRLTGTGVALTSNDSFLPDLRSSKDEGQSNFVNPGIYLYNAGADAKLTQSLKLVGNVNFLQFARTQSLVFLLQQAGIPRTIGVDSSIAAIYRPFLSDNIVISGGAAALAPGRGLRSFYTAQTLFSVFATVKFQF
jgi:Carboxypeptidase regulatory-like domain